MTSNSITPNTANLTKGLDIVELEERLEMVHLSAIEAEASWKCDLSTNDVEIAQDAALDGRA